MAAARICSSLRVPDHMAAAAQLKASLEQNQGFLDNTNVGAASFTNSQNQSVFSSNLKNVPKQYQRAKKTPLILCILTILTGVGIVFLSSTWQKGLRHIGINLAVIGVVMLIFSYALNRAVVSQVLPRINNTVSNAALRQNVRNLAADLTRQVDKNYWFFGGLYTVLGAGSITAAEFYRRRAEPKIQIAKVDSDSPKPSAPKR